MENIIPLPLPLPFIFIILSIVVLIATIGVATILRTPVNHLTLFESIFTGRFAGPAKKGKEKGKVGEKEKETYEPQLIRIPCREGFHIKKFWFKATHFDQKARKRKLQGRNYQTSDDKVFVTGTIEWRYSRYGLFRVVETNDTIVSGLDALIDQAISEELGLKTTEECRKRTASVNTLLEGILMADSSNPCQKIKRRDGDFHILSVVEARYGIEILSVNIEDIKPSDEIAAMLTKSLSETLEAKWQATERDVLKSDMEMYSGYDVDPDLSAKLAAERQGNLGNNITDERFHIKTDNSIMDIATLLFKKEKKNGGDS